MEAFKLKKKPSEIVKAGSLLCPLPAFLTSAGLQNFKVSSHTKRSYNSPNAIDASPMLLHKDASLPSPSDHFTLTEPLGKSADLPGFSRLHAAARCLVPTSSSKAAKRLQQEDKAVTREPWQR